MGKRTASWARRLGCALLVTLGGYVWAFPDFNRDSRIDGADVHHFLSQWAACHASGQWDAACDLDLCGSLGYGDAVILINAVLQPPEDHVVGTGGGQVVAARGAVTLGVPPGAVGQDTVLWAELAPAYPADPDMVPGAVFDFAPDGIIFAQPVAATLEYDPARLPAGMAEAALRLCRCVDGVWEAVSGSTVDTGADTVTGTVSGFSMYGVGAKGLGQQYEYVSSFGSFGYAVGKFIAPFGIALAPNGDIFVVDTGDAVTHRVEKFSGGSVSAFGSHGSGAGQFNCPLSVALDPVFGNLHVVDFYNHRIVKFDTWGNYAGTFGARGWEDGNLSYPEGIAIDKDGYIYVADTLNYRVQKFDVSGKFVKQWGQFAEDPGGLGYPNAVAVDNLGNVFVADKYLKMVHKFSNTGEFRMRWGSYGTGPGQFAMPRGIATDAAGNVYVTDETNNNVQKFTGSGVLLARWGAFGTGNGQFNMPDGIAVDKDGYVYVVEYYGRRVQKFRKG